VMEVVVEDKQLSLAIGKKGQNVRLAAKLTGWRIDIKSEEEKRREVEAQFEGLEASPTEESAAEGETGDAGEGATQGIATEAVEAGESTEAALPYTLPGIGEKTVRKLVDGGMTTLAALKDASAEQLSEIPGIGAKTAEKILAAAREKTPAREESQPEQEESQ